MEADTYSESLHEQWNALNRGARNGHFLFDRMFMEYHADRFIDASIVIAHEGELAGLVPANVNDGTVFSHQGLTFGGLVSNANRTSRIMEMMDLGLEVWTKLGVKRLVYKALPWIYHRQPAQEDLYWLSQRGAQLVRRDLSTTINLASPAARSSRRMRGMQKAKRAGLTFGRSDRISDFWRVLETTLADRHAVSPTHSLAEIQLLQRRFPSEIVLYVAANSEGDLAAGVLLFLSVQVAHAQYIAASTEGRQVSALDGLFDYILADIAGRHLYFDFGISTVDEGRTLNEGLVRQKEEFGGSAVVHDVYELAL